MKVLTFLALAVMVAAAHARQRNVLLIIADDLGTDSLSPYNSHAGAVLSPTPNIDALKANGAQFRNACAQPTCSPTRAGILTGRHPFRHGVTTAVTANDGHLMAGEFTLPRAFAANGSLGYDLAHFGKWHLSLGNTMANDPANLGGWQHYAGSLNGGLTGGNGGTGTYFAWTKTINGLTGPVNGTTTYATTYTGGANAAMRLNTFEKAGENVVLRWDSAEGGNYVIESSADLTNWTAIPQVPADGAAFETQATVPAASPGRSFHRIRSHGVDAYDVIDTP
jgi:hypothetical protein